MEIYPIMATVNVLPQVNIDLAPFNCSSSLWGFLLPAIRAIP
jgi:hypothetical protein